VILSDAEITSWYDFKVKATVGNTEIVAVEQIDTGGVGGGVGVGVGVGVVGGVIAPATYVAPKL
jgi:hypothetical protein